MCLLKSQFPLSEGNISLSSADLSVDEESALHYVEGYMIRSLQKKIERQKPKLMEEIIFALHSFLEDREQCDQSDITDESDDLDWVKVLDRGGLFHCCMEFINFLCAMEVVVKGKMIRGNEAAMKAGFNEKLALEVHQNEDVLFWWSNLCDVTNVDNECSKALVHYVVDHYVVIRGFAFAARWMEVFKQGSKKNIRGTKSLRKKLQTTTIS